MSYDINITNKEPGLVQFELPSRIIKGTRKLLQQVMILLLSDDGQFIEYVGGKSNNASLNDDVLISEAARVTEIINNTSSVNVPDSERLEELEITKIEEEGTYARVNVSVTAVNQDIDSTILNL